VRAILSALMILASSAHAGDALSELRGAEAGARSAAQALSNGSAKEGVSTRFDGGTPAERADAPVFSASRQAGETVKAGNSAPASTVKAIDGPIRDGGAAKPDSLGKKVLAVGLIALVTAGAVVAGVATGGVLGVVIGALGLIAGRALFRLLF